MALKLRSHVTLGNEIKYINMAVADRVKITVQHSKKCPLRNFYFLHALMS
jgi:hypothetical protein